MIKNNAGIQQFLDAAHEETDKSGKQCDLITFNEFWDEKYGDRIIRLVFIGQHMDKKKIIQVMNDCLDE